MERLTPEVQFLSKNEKRILETSYHEVGHSIVGKDLGATVFKESVKREGNVLGHVLLSFERFSLREKAFRMMAALAGGWVAEDLIGKSDHRGTGSDMAKLDYLADYASKFFYSNMVTAQSLKSRAFSLAHSILSYNPLFHHKAWNLYQKQVIV